MAEASNGLRGRGKGGPVVVGVVALAIVIALAAGAFAIVRGLALRDARLALTPDEAVKGLGFPEFSLTDQDGKSFGRADVLGRVTVVDFFFTNCPFVCPMLSHNMLDMQKRLAGSGVRFLSVSVDPEHDTVERVREYAKGLGADTATWAFARGDIETVRRISEGGFTLGVGEDASRSVTLPDGRVMANIAHASKFVVVGPDGSALAMGSGMEAGDVTRLTDRARAAALAAAARGRR